MKTQLIATHLNAPYGPIVTAASVEHALRTGQLPAVPGEPAPAILSSLFVECAPEILTACAAELRVPLENLQRLYLSLTAQQGGALYRSPEWEATWAAVNGDQ